jgi:NhaP-type Na+/H+ or K+/H+ antiporter
VIPLSIVVVICGVMVRCPVAAFAVSGADLDPREKAFVGLAWIPKATVQAALGGLPLDLVRTTLDPEHDKEQYIMYERFGLQILTTAIFSILVTAPIGLLVIQHLGHRWLHNDGEEIVPRSHEQRSSKHLQRQKAEAIDSSGKSNDQKGHDLEVICLDDIRLGIDPSPSRTISPRLLGSPRSSRSR